MTKWWTRLGAALAAAGLLWACEGGQTGQPTASACDSPWIAVPADQSISGVSPRELARASAGRYTAPLRWRTGSNNAEQVGAVDEITVVLAYQGADGSTNDCADMLRVDMTVDVTTRDSALHETGTVSLEARIGAVEPAMFLLNGNQVNVAVQLGVDAGQVVISGTLQSNSDATPSSVADFTSESLGQAGAGGQQ